jgi:hypothetical protein
VRNDVFIPYAKFAYYIFKVAELCKATRSIESFSQTKDSDIKSNLDPLKWSFVQTGECFPTITRKPILDKLEPVESYSGVVLYLY